MQQPPGRMQQDHGCRSIRSAPDSLPASAHLSLRSPRGSLPLCPAGRMGRTHIPEEFPCRQACRCFLFSRPLQPSVRLRSRSPFRSKSQCSQVQSRTGRGASYRKYQNSDNQHISLLCILCRPFRRNHLQSNTPRIPPRSWSACPTDKPFRAAHQQAPLQPRLRAVTSRGYCRPPSQGLDRPDRLHL